MKLLLMVYPIKRYVDYNQDHPFTFQQNTFCLNLFERGYTDSLQLAPGIFRKRFSLINNLINEYRQKGFKVGWAFFSQSKESQEPDIATVSDIFEMNPEDYKISVKVTYEDLMRDEHYPDEENILKVFPGLEKLVVGGFHSRDCVQRFADAAKKMSISTSVDPLLTEEFFPLILNGFSYDLEVKLISEGLLDPEAHDYDPEEMKQITMDKRLYRHVSIFQKMS